MRKWKLILTSGFVIFITALTASQRVVESALTLAEEGSVNRDTQIVRVYFPDRDTANKIFLSFEGAMIETNYEERYHIMKVTKNEMALLTEAGLQAAVDNEWEPPPRIVSQVESAPAGIPGYSCYETVEETFDEADGIVNDYPDLATWIDTGDSWEKTSGPGGYDMVVLRLTHSAVPGDKPKFFATCAIHACEYTTAPLCLRFAHYLVDNYGIDADATWILDHHEVHLMFHTNPDGRKQAESGDLWRKNTNQDYCGATSSDRGADLNRNFEYNWGCCGGSSGYECDSTYRGPYRASEPEVQAVQNYMRTIFPDQRGPGSSDAAPDDATGVHIDFHSYSELVLWPWGYTSNPAPNGTQMQTLGRRFAFWNGYTPAQKISLYATEGTTKDFGYGDLGVASFTFELGTAFFQSCSYYENRIVPDNLPAMIYAAKVTRTPYMTPAGPNTYEIQLSQDNIPAGTFVTLNAIVDDTQYNNSNGTEPTQDIAAAEYYVDVPPWVSDPFPAPIAMSPSDGSFNNQVEAVETTIDTTGWSEGQHILFVRGQDDGANWGAFSAIFIHIEDMDCFDDSDCDDGVFCNGDETCVSGTCQEGGDACAAGQFCDEAKDACVDCPVDADGDVDGSDLAALAQAFGSSSGDPNYNPAADFDGDGTIDEDDLAPLAGAFGQTDCP